jgi:hypothetical protein
MQTGNVVSDKVAEGRLKQLYPQRRWDFFNSTFAASVVRDQCPSIPSRCEQVVGERGLQLIEDDASSLRFLGAGDVGGPSTIAGSSLLVEASANAVIGTERRS